MDRLDEIEEPDFAKDAKVPESEQTTGGFLPEESLPHAFTVVATRVSTTLQKMYMERFGISVVGWRLIAILGSHSPLSAKALAELMAMDQVSISRALEQLVGKRLVSRRVDPTDRRRVVLRLSKRGEEVYSEVVPVLQAADTAVTSGLSDEDARTFRQLMKRILAHSATVLPDDGDWQSLLATHGPACGPIGRKAGTESADD